MTLKSPEYYDHLSRGFNNGDNWTLVPYEVTLYNNGIIVKKSPHPVVSDHIFLCEIGISRMTHECWPIGFNFITFHYVNADHEQRVDFIETTNLFPDNQKYMFEACSDLKIGDKECPRFHTKGEAFEHCINLIKKEFNISENKTGNRCIKRRVCQ